MQSEKPIIIIAVILIVALLIGEVFVYATHEEYSAEASRTSDGMEWSISSTGSDSYNILVLDNGSFLSKKTICLYLDERYGHTSSPGKQPVGSKALNPDHYLDLLEKELKNRGVTDVRYVNADTLVDVMKDLENSDEKALVMVSGSIPDTVYGDVDLLTTWIGSGGTLFWAGGIIGEYVSHKDGTTTQIADGPQRFLGVDCVNPLQPEGDQNAGLVDKVITDNQLQKILGIGSNSILYSVDPSRLNNSIGHLSLGFTDGKYSSIAYVQSGSGQICVVGGDLTHQQNYDMSQMIASGLYYGSKVIASEDGKVFSTTISGNITFTSVENVRAYIYLGHGSNYLVYGRGFDL